MGLPTKQRRRNAVRRVVCKLIVFTSRETYHGFLSSGQLDTLAGSPALQLCGGLESDVSSVKSGYRVMAFLSK